MNHPEPFVRATRRTGGALLIAVALMALASALLVGATASARSVARAAKSHEASVIADAESRVVIAGILQAWTPADDSLRVGTARAFVVGPRVAGWGGALVVTRIRVQRLSPRHYVVATECQVGPDSAVLARRRMRLVLERAPSSDSTLPFSSPAPLGQWSLSDLFL